MEYLLDQRTTCPGWAQRPIMEHRDSRTYYPPWLASVRRVVATFLRRRCRNTHREVEAMSKGQVRGTKRSVRPNSVTAKSKKGAHVRPAPDEAESMRLQLLAEVGEVEEAPGQLDGLLDRAYLADSFFEEHVLQDPACLRSPELFREALGGGPGTGEFLPKGRAGGRCGGRRRRGCGEHGRRQLVKRLSCTEMMRLLERHDWFASTICDLTSAFSDLRSYMRATPSGARQRQSPSPSCH